MPGLEYLGMKALRFDRTGDLAALHLTDLPAPPLLAGEVLVQVRAAGLNPSDVKNVQGRFPYTTLPRTPGRDFAGVVVAGPEAMLGWEVWGTGKELGFIRDGSHAELLAVPAEGVAPKPESLSFAQAASCGVPYTTAWEALERAGADAGRSLVVIGAAGAVGRAAVALGRWRGARVAGAVRRTEHAENLIAQGVPVIVLGEGESLPDAVRARFPAGADVIFDTTGAWLPAAVPALAPFGRIAVIAAPADGKVSLPVLDLYRRGGSVVGINSLLHDTRACAHMLERFGPAFDSGRLPLPQGIRERPLDDAIAAYGEVDRGAGEKIVFVP
jgi:NADPH2:quinone reductase